MSGGICPVRIPHILMYKWDHSEGRTTDGRTDLHLSRSKTVPARPRAAGSNQERLIIYTDGRYRG